MKKLFFFPLFTIIVLSGCASAPEAPTPIPEPIPVPENLPPEVPAVDEDEIPAVSATEEMQPNADAAATEEEIITEIDTLFDDLDNI